VKTMTHKTRAVGWMACLVWVLNAPWAGAFWPFSPTKENPFTGRSFITDWTPVHDSATSLLVYVFDTDTSVTIGHLALYFAEGRSTGMIDVGQPSFPYTVDYEKRKIRFSVNNREYSYEDKGKVITLKTATETINLYEVDQPAFFLPGADADPQRLAKYSKYWNILRDRGLTFDEAREKGLDGYGAVKAVAEENTRAVRNYLDNMIARIKGEPPVPLPDVSSPPNPPPVDTEPPRSPTPVVATAAASAVAVASNPTPSSAPARSDGTVDAQSELTVDDLVNGEYQGTLKDTGDGSQWKFEMRLGSLGEPTGQPPMASIEATMKFEGVETEERLIGAAVYSGETQLTMAGNSPRGTMTLKCRLSGDRLSGTWDSKGADGQTTAGTLEAARTGP